MNLPGAARNSAISSCTLPARTFFELINTSGTKPVTAIGSKSSIEYFTLFDTCGTTTTSEVSPTSSV